MKYLTGLGLLLLLLACDHSQNKSTAYSYRIIEGKTMGTYYRITYQDSLRRAIQPVIELSLFELNDELSTYIDSSLIRILTDLPKQKLRFRSVPGIS